MNLFYGVPSDSPHLALKVKELVMRFNNRELGDNFFVFFLCCILSSYSFSSIDDFNAVVNCFRKLSI